MAKKRPIVCFVLPVEAGVYGEGLDISSVYTEHNLISAEVISSDEDETLVEFCFSSLADAWEFWKDYFEGDEDHNVEEFFAITEIR